MSSEKHLSHFEQSRLNFTDPKTGELRLRNPSNLIFGPPVAWGAFLLAAVSFNKSSMHGPDPMSWKGTLSYDVALFIISLGSYRVGRSVVAIRDGLIRVQNPLREYTFSLKEVQSVNDGPFGFPVIQLVREKIILFAIPESVYLKVRGGSKVRWLLDESLNQALALGGMSVEKPTAHKLKPEFRDNFATWKFFDRWTVLLLTAWAFFAASFLLPR